MREEDNRRLGRAHLWLSATTLHVGFRDMVAQSAAFSALDAFWAEGGRSFQLDLCREAGTGVFNVRNAGVLTSWMQARRLAREKAVLALRLTPRSPSSGGCVTFLNQLRTQVEQACSQLSTDYLDLLVCRWTTPHLAVNDLAEAIDLLTRAGLIRYAVAEDWPLWRIADLCVRASLARSARVEAIQVTQPFGVHGNSESEEIGNVCRTYRLGLLLQTIEGRHEVASNREPLASLEPVLTSLVRAPDDFASTGTRENDSTEAPRPALTVGLPS